MKDSSAKKLKKTKRSFDTSELSEPAQNDTETTLSTFGEKYNHVKKKKKRISEEPVQDVESFSLLNTKKNKAKKSKPVFQSSSFLDQINLEELLKTDSDSDDTDNRKKLKLIVAPTTSNNSQSIFETSTTENTPKQKKSNTTQSKTRKSLEDSSLPGIVKKEIFDVSTEIDSSTDSEIINKSKSTGKETTKKKTKTKSVKLNGSNNEETLSVNVKMEANSEVKPKKLKIQNSDSEVSERINGDSSVNSFYNNRKKKAKTKSINLNDSNNEETLSANLKMEANSEVKPKKLKIQNSDSEVSERINGDSSVNSFYNNTKKKAKTKSINLNDSNNEESLSINVVMVANSEVKPKKRRLRYSDTEEPEWNNGYSSLNSSLNDKNVANTFQYSPLKGPEMTFLANNCFEVDFEVPLLHKILNRASRPTDKQRNMITSLGLPVKHGKFTKQEDAQILENWEYFINVNGLENEPKKFFCLDKKCMTKASKNNFLFYLARNMPERTPLSVFSRFKLLLAKVKTGRFTQDEDNEILEAIRNDATIKVNVPELARMLQRSTQAIEKRMRLLKLGPVRKIKWNERNSATFIKHLLRVTKVGNVEELQHRTITAEEWNDLSAKLDGYPAKSLKRVWSDMIYSSLFIPVDMVDVRQIKLALIKLMVQNGETDWNKVNWSSYQEYFPGFTSAKLYTLMRQLIKTFVPKVKWGNLKKCLKILMKIRLENICPLTIFKMKYGNGVYQKECKFPVEQGNV